jgi:hypothetical protein
MCRRTDVPCFTLIVVTHATSQFVHVSSVRPITLQRVTSRSYDVSCMKFSNCTATSAIRSYNLYSQLPHGTVWTVQSTFFCLFGKMNRIRYWEHTTFVLSLSSCIVFLSTRSMHTSVLKPLREHWFLGLSEPHQAPGSKSGSHLPTKGTFGPQNVTKWILLITYS